MMNNGTFRKVEKSEKTLYGSRAALVCGFEPEAQEILSGFFRVMDIKDLAVVFPTDTDDETSIMDLLSRPDQSGQGISSALECAIILAGITENELHRILSGFRGLGLPRPLWATLTPISQSWPLSTLISELKKERAAMEKRKSI
jgi:hypothetical protein